MLCCHGNNRWKQRILIVAFFIAGPCFLVHGESINNASQPEIALAPEMDVPVTVPQSKSPLNPQEMADLPPQVHVANPSTAEPKTQVAAPPEIPEVETGLSDRDKQNTHQEPNVRDQTTHAPTVVESTHKKTGTEILTSEGSEATSDYTPTEPEEADYASGSGHTEIAWEWTRTEVTSEKSRNLSSSDLDATHSNSSSGRNRGVSEDVVQTEVVYDFHSTEETFASATNSSGSLFETSISRNAAASEHPVPSAASPSEQPHLFPTSTAGYGDHSNVSNGILIPTETEHAVIAGSIQMQNSSTEPPYLAATPISNASQETQYEVGSLADEPSLPQHVMSYPVSTENVKSIAEDISTSSNLSGEVTFTQASNSSTIGISVTTTRVMDSREAVQVSGSALLNNNSRVSGATDVLNSSFLIQEFQTKHQVPVRIINESVLPSLSTPFIYHFTSGDDFKANLSNTNSTFGEKHNAVNDVVSGTINPTKPSSDTEYFASNDTQSARTSDVKHSSLDADVQPKQDNDTKSKDNGNKTLDPSENQSDINKNAKVVDQTTSVSNLTAGSVQSPWATSMPELASSIQAILATDLPSLTSSMVLKSPSDSHSTVMFHGNSSIFPSTIQPNQTLKVPQSDSTETSRGNKPTRTPDVDSDHILPTVKIPTTYLSMTLRCSWSHFCLHQDDLRSIFSQYLTNATKYAIKSSQIVYFNTNVCKHVTYSDNEVNDGFVNSIVVQMYVANWHGVPSEKLTERLGFLLVKNRLQGFNDKMKLQDVVLAVQLHREERVHTASALPRNDGGVSDMGIIAAITISGIAGVCLLLLCIMLVVLKRRQILKQQSRRCRPVRADAYSLDSISIYSSFYKRKMRASKRSYLNQGFDDPNAPNNKVNFAGLANLSSDENALAEEYKQIPMAMAKLEDLPPGADLKNRYANVIPFPETRVQLQAKEGDPTLGYINANYVRGFRGDQRTYIACQAPLESTVSDFWEMVWENQCKVIIMLTDWEEEGVAKCFPYFAESSTMDSHRRFGDFQVSTKKIDTRESFTISSLQLKNLEKNLMRDVFHYWYTAWPALGVPSDKVSIVEMLTEARGTMRAASAPTVVHCSPGTGRTGTVLAIHTSMQEYEMSRTVDIPQCVYRLRRDRGGCVQTSEQYRFIYEVIHEFASQFRNPSGRSSIRSSK